MELVKAQALGLGKDGPNITPLGAVKSVTAAKAGSSVPLIPTAEALGFHKMPFHTRL